MQRSDLMRETHPGEPLAIGRYRIAGVIGQGGMGTVYLGVAPNGRLAAIKQAHALLAQDPQAHMRFAREVAAARRVSGTFTAAVLDADTRGERPWLATEFVAGPSLEHAVSAAGPLPAVTVWRLAGGLAAALQEIHRVGLIHRDLKPGNVLLTAEGPRVIDFGIAASTGEAVGQLTRTGFVVGSPAYMAPEQVNGSTLTSAADLFTLGTVLAYAASGLRPFGSGTSQEVLGRVVAGQPDLSAVPPGLLPMIAALLRKDPSQRPTAEQVVRAIGAFPTGVEWLPAPVRQLIATVEADARRLVDVPRPSGGVRGSRRAGKVGMAATAVVASLVVGLGTAVAVRAAEPPPTVQPEQAAALVTAVLPDRPPAGFRPEQRDGAPVPPGDPLKIDRSRSEFACDVRADPPLPAEAGMVAANGVTFQEDVGQLPDRFRVWQFYGATYLDPGSRGDIMAQFRGRIGACRIHVPPHFTAVRFSDNTVPGADENVGWISDLPLPADFPHFRQQVGACEFARVDAVVVRACKLISKRSSAEGSLSRDAELRSATREMLAPLVDKARSLQQRS